MLLSSTFTSLALTLFCLSGLVSADDYLVSRARSIGRAKRSDQTNTITILHVNDVHAHLDQFTAAGGNCDGKKTCFGGYARIKTKVEELRQKYPNSLLINAGDEFQGTQFYSYYGHTVISETINQIGFDAMTLGNHEFDGGDENLIQFIKALTFPVICANVESTKSGLTELLHDYWIFPKQELAVVGVTTADTPDISHPDPGTRIVHKFLESAVLTCQRIILRDTKFLDPLKTLQITVNRIKEKHPEIKRIIAITHIGYDSDIQFAQEIEGVQLTIGGHSHTLLGNFDKSEGDYPTIVKKNRYGDEVFVVTASKWGQYLGKIDLTYDEDGKIASYHGSPIVMESDIKPDATIHAQVAQWRQGFHEKSIAKIGSTQSDLNYEECIDKECMSDQHPDEENKCTTAPTSDA
ncbi:hypothetical protein FRB94_009713 [Tulasnella sp. JGI-2019a]|nr:hypothetical protein FRB94_009713 [Tulasnella sp. JGI-2019a]